MSQQRQTPDQKSKHQGAEMLLFLVVSAIGIYGLGQGLGGLFEPGQGINLFWLAVAAGALVILGAQMGRVQETWPHRKQQAASSVTEQARASVAKPAAQERSSS